MKGPSMNLTTRKQKILDRAQLHEQGAMGAKSMNKFEEKNEIAQIHTGEVYQFSLKLMVSMPYNAVI